MILKVLYLLYLDRLLRPNLENRHTFKRRTDKAPLSRQRLYLPPFTLKAFGRLRLIKYWAFTCSKIITEAPKEAVELVVPLLLILNRFTPSSSVFINNFEQVTFLVDFDDCLNDNDNNDNDNSHDEDVDRSQ